MIALRRFWFLVFAALAVFSTPAFAQDKVLYHIDNAAEQGMKALRNVRNQIDAEPTTKIIVVTHGDGVDLLLDGAKDPKSQASYGPLIADLKSRGVHFEVCMVTMKRRNLTKSQFVLEADFVPSGVVRITQLQNREHFAYIKP